MRLLRIRRRVCDPWAIAARLVGWMILWGAIAALVWALVDA